MGTYKPADWYDDSDKWMNKVVYKPPWPRLHWWVYRFKRMCDLLPKGTKNILDLGCGNGLFAAMLKHEAKYEGRYLGVDFSKGSIDMARKGNHERGGNEGAQFRVAEITDVGELLTKALLEWECRPFDLITCAETLEHVKDDRAIVESIPKDMMIMITVPCFDAEAHLRAFPDWQSVQRRYGDLLDIKVKELMHNAWRPKHRGCWLFVGKRK